MTTTANSAADPGLPNLTVPTHQRENHEATDVAINDCQALVRGALELTEDTGDAMTLLCLLRARIEALSELHAKEWTGLGVVNEVATPPRR